jgi:hypothetical protein
MTENRRQPIEVAALFMKPENQQPQSGAAAVRPHDHAVIDRARRGAVSAAIRNIFL